MKAEPKHKSKVRDNLQARERKHQEDALDDALKNTFPASRPGFEPSSRLHVVLEADFCFLGILYARTSRLQACHREVGTTSARTLWRTAHSAPLHIDQAALLALSNCIGDVIRAYAVLGELPKRSLELCRCAALLALSTSSQSVSALSGIQTSTFSARPCRCARA